MAGQASALSSTRSRFPEHGFHSALAGYTRFMQPQRRPHYVWDYDIDVAEFREILAGRTSKGRLDQDWAARRLLEYGSYREVVEAIGFRRLVENWPRWRAKVRSKSRVRGFDFLVQWLPARHPELLRD